MTTRPCNVCEINPRADGKRTCASHIGEHWLHQPGENWVLYRDGTYVAWVQSDPDGSFSCNWQTGDPLEWAHSKTGWHATGLDPESAMALASANAAQP